MIQYAGERKKTRRPAPTPGSWSARATTCASREPASVSSRYILRYLIFGFLHKKWSQSSSKLRNNRYPDLSLEFYTCATTCASWEPASVRSGYIFQSERIYFSIYLMFDFLYTKWCFSLWSQATSKLRKKQTSRSFIGVLYSRHHFRQLRTGLREQRIFC